MAGHVCFLGLAILSAGCSSCGAREKTPPGAGEPTTSGSATASSSAAAPTSAERGGLFMRGKAAFPGAEGFGKDTNGGRGGGVCIVKTLAKEGEGSLAACLAAEGKRTVVFRVGGVVEGPLTIKHGGLTIAGQTAPGGITIKGGVVCDNVYDPNDCNDVIVRHVRFRGGAPDSFRIGGAHDVILDHVSLAGAEDENLEITRSRDITIQHAMIAEPVGDHYKYGGVLLNYSKDTLPLDRISIHHSVWNGVAGRLPEISCEENDDGPGKTACAGHVLHLDLVNNVAWDARDPIWYNRCTGNNEGNGCAPSARDFFLALNLVNNVLVRRAGTEADLPFIEPAVFSAGRNEIFHSGNLQGRGIGMLPMAAAKASVPKRLDHPFITTLPAADLPKALAATVGAFPRDPMDQRLVSYLHLPVDARPPAWASDKGIARGDGFNTLPSQPAPPDTDDDGIPDAWETSHKLDPRRPDNANFGFPDTIGHGVSGCTRGYSALECYLNELADRLR